MPVLINPDLPSLRAVLGAADAVVEVLDARDPLAGRSAHLEEVAAALGRRVVLVLAKVGAYAPAPMLSLSSFGLCSLFCLFVFFAFLVCVSGWGCVRARR